MADPLLLTLSITTTEVSRMQYFYRAITLPMIVYRWFCCSQTEVHISYNKLHAEPEQGPSLDIGKGIHRLTRITSAILICLTA